MLPHTLHASNRAHSIPGPGGPGHALAAVVFVHYPREGHVPCEPRHRPDSMARMLASWDRWIR